MMRGVRHSGCRFVVGEKKGGLVVGVLAEADASAGTGAGAGACVGGKYFDLINL